MTKIQEPNSHKSGSHRIYFFGTRFPYLHSGKDGKPDSWFLFDSYKRKQSPVTKIQEPNSHESGFRQIFFRDLVSIFTF